MKSSKPVVFLAFADDRQNSGRILSNLEQERRGLAQTLRQWQQTGEGDFFISDGGIRKLIQDLNREQGRLMLFHFAGHGNGTSLQLEEQIGKTDVLASENLASLLAEEQHLACVFLNACATKDQIQILFKKGIRSVIATSRDILDNQASQFSQTFYQSLVAGKSLHMAFQQARIELEGDKANPRQYPYRSFLAKQQTESGVFPWGLYYQDEAVLSWSIRDAEYIGLTNRLRQGSLKRFEELRGPGGRYEHLDIAEILLTAVKGDASLIETQVKLAGDTLGKRESVEKLWAQSPPHSIIMGDGGMGKTVSLLRLWESFLGEHEGPIPLFVQLNEFNQAQDDQRGKWLTWYLARHYLGERPLTPDTERQLWDWLQADWDRPYPKVILLLDGFNEITVDQTSLLIALQQEWRGKARHIQLLLTSRYGNNFTWASDFHTLELQPLAESTAQAYLTDRGHPWPAEDYSDMRRLLTNPMMLTLYAATSEVMAEHTTPSDTYFKPTASTGELMWNFLQAQSLKYEEQYPTDPATCAYHRWLLWHLLPTIGYEMEQQGLFEFSRKQLKDAIAAYLQKAEDQIDIWIEVFPACERVWEDLEDDPEAESFAFKTLQQALLSQLRMLKKEGSTYAFLHQNFRDFFAALHLHHQIQLDVKQQQVPSILKPRVLSLYLRRMLGEMEGEHHQAARLEKQGWTIAHQQASLLTQALNCCRGHRGEAARGLAVFNLLEIIHEVRGEWTGLSLHDLDLSFIRLNRRIHRKL